MYTPVKHGVEQENSRSHSDGVCIIGVGLPRISEEQDIMKKYYSSQGYNGFGFAYVIPEMNKV